VKHRRGTDGRLDAPARRAALTVVAGISLVSSLAGCSASGSSPLSAATGTSSAATLGPGAHIVFTAPVPTNGTIGVGGGAVWVVDRQGADSADPEAAGLLRITPETGTITKRIRGVIGASISATDDAVWVASAATGRLIRVSLDGADVMSITTAPPDAGDDIYPYGVVATNDGIWVANHHLGTIARVDPRTNALVASVSWGEPGGGGPTHLATDGSSVWVTSVRTMELAEIDVTTNEISNRFDLAPVGACGGLAADSGAVWSASGFDRPFPCWQPEHWGLSRLDRATGAVARLDVGGRPADVELGFGSVWVLTDEPTTELLRLDPSTNAIVGRLALPMRPDHANPLAIGLGALWVRLIAVDGLADGAIVKIQPDD
jgi:hypothetical protein